MVGIIIGSTIYESSPDIAAGAARWAAVSAQWWGVSGGHEAMWAIAAIVGVWLAGGFIALIGALCYAELATAYPQAGGTYLFLSEAFGRSVGFAFAWFEFWIVRPGNVGAIAFVLASYGRQIIAPATDRPNLVETALALTAILGLSLINAIELRAGKWTQNLLTAAKLIGLVAIVLVALSIPPAVQNIPAAARPWQTLSLSLILVMFAYGGWADLSFVAAEVHNPKRNISRALVLGIVVVTVVYLAVTLAFVWSLGVNGLTTSQAVAAKAMSLRFGPSGATAISALVVISCLGTINGMMFAGARVFYAMGANHPTFRWLGVWDATKGVPLRSLIVQTVVTLGLVAGFGAMREGFKGLVIFTGPFYWGFIGLVGAALIVLRYHRHDDGTYRVPLYPLPPLILLASGAVMTWSAVQYVIQQRSVATLWGVGAMWACAVVLVGALVGRVDRRIRMRASSMHTE
jgi:APA family basic amino acid/polyamine antiporter